MIHQSSMDGNSRRSQPLFGLIAEFDVPEQVLNAAAHAYAQGYRCMDAYSPFPVAGLAEALGHRRRAVPAIFLMAGLIGACSGYLLQWYSMAIDYPINVGGRPLHSWPAFIPITFELTILAAGLAGAAGMIFLNRLPQLYHPVFAVSGIERATIDRFFLEIRASDPQFDAELTREFLVSLKPRCVSEVVE